MNDVADRYDRNGVATLTSQFSNIEPALCVSEPYRFLREELARIRHTHGKATPHLLDLCCGVGAMAVAAGFIGFEVTGIDLSPKSIDAARAYAGFKGLESRCRFIVGDVLAALREQPPASVLFCSGSLYYLELKEAFPKIMDNIEAGGHFLGVETNGSCLWMNGLRRLRNRLRPYRDQRTVTRLLRVEDFDWMAGRLHRSQLRYFDFFTLAGVVLRRWPSLGRGYHAVARRLDYVFLNILGFRRFAFKVVIHGYRHGRRTAEG